MIKVNLLASDCFLAWLEQISANVNIQKSKTFFCGCHKNLLHKMLVTICDPCRFFVRRELLELIALEQCECGKPLLYNVFQFE